MKLLRELIKEDWGSSDWSAAIKHFVEDLNHFDGEDGVYDMMSAAYETASFYNDDRQYQGDEWSHFSPMQLIKMTVTRNQMPKDRMEDAEAIQNKQFSDRARMLAREME